MRKYASYLIAAGFILVLVASALGDGSPVVQDEPIRSEQQPQTPEFAVVASVIDGDTIDLRSGERVRLIGIDTPERGESGHEAARERLAQLVLSRNVRLVRDTNDRDQYRRLLRYVYIDEVFVNELLVSEGLARQFPFGEDRMFQEQIAAAEAFAKEQNIGMWKK